jgi:hypothetical protein
MSQVNVELLSACEASLKWVALHTPFPIGDPQLDPILQRIGDESDALRSQLRRAIKLAKSETPRSIVNVEDH